ncbi:hypothetical protein I302_107506 [Kwoniella bestiolae CBS 10118]|uniref:Beta-lactamase-related domain-containing protein n=1 Tax=Kwoniella bestiolae CBS 10118 TaxID=1296100 RepID=A0A1B9FYC7_9TREE|nr:hypothetical protein I302_06753 [Kwoniella bestiolae CBS 10118]OCF23769.1 hypothetical protein I302_06753 [Kwoniella bestiolae CBS 10118]
MFSVIPFLIYPYLSRTYLYLIGRSAPNTDSNSILSDKTKTWLDDIQKSYDIPGLAVSIVTSPSSSHSNTTQFKPADRFHSETLTFGFRNLNGDPLTSDSLFSIGSNTKLFVAISVGLLIDKNITLHNGETLDWTTRIIDVLPSWGLVDKQAEGETTIQDLLLMRTGVPFHPYAPNHADSSSLLNMMSHLPPSSHFRNKWQYNNDNYLILAHIVSVLSRQPFTDFLQYNFLEPLGMTSALFDPIEAKWTGKRSDAILRIGKGMEIVSSNSDGRQIKLQGQKRNIDWWTKGKGESMWGSAGLIMSINDVTRWLQELLSPTLITQSILEKCAEDQISADNLLLPDTVNCSYGYGQWTSNYRGYKVLIHYGYMLGQHTLFARLPDEGIAIGAMNLGDGIGFRVNRAIVYTLLDELLGLEKKDWQESILDTWVLEQVQEHADLINKAVDSPQQMDEIDVRIQGSYHHPAWNSLHFRRFLTSSHDLSLGQLLQAQTMLGPPSFVAAMPGREDWYILLHSNGAQYIWTIIQLHDDHRLTEVIENGIVRVLGRGSAAINEDGMGMFGGFWSFDSATFKYYAEGKDPKADAEVWFDRLNS